MSDMTIRAESIAERQLLIFRGDRSVVKKTHELQEKLDIEKFKLMRLEALLSYAAGIVEAGAINEESRDDLCCYVLAARDFLKQGDW